ncbi:hypothetical protein [Roseovarius mucosus]|uniref:hypothetical protein n=1 Tax=Roseovarius mucosus TaxID=215743 RepID=UPI003BAC30AD
MADKAKKLVEFGGGDLQELRLRTLARRQIAGLDTPRRAAFGRVQTMLENRAPPRRRDPRPCGRRGGV